MCAPPFATTLNLRLSVDVRNKARGNTEVESYYSEYTVQSANPGIYLARRHAVCMSIFPYNVRKSVFSRGLLSAEIV